MSEAAGGGPVVTISAPFGAGGSVVGPALAERLGVPFLDRAIPVAVSSRLEISEAEALERDLAPHAGVGRWISFFGPAMQMVAGAPLGLPTVADEVAFREATETVLHERAATGAVILGRAGAIVLRDVPHALHVRLNGPRERRIEQGMHLQGLGREEAERELRASDVTREAYVKHWYGVDPADCSHYHLVIDSTRIDLDRCVELIVLALTSR